MAYTTEQFLKLKLPQPNTQEKEKAEDKHYNDLAELIEQNPQLPWLPTKPGP